MGRHHRADAQAPDPARRVATAPSGDPGADGSRNHVSVHFDGKLTQEVDLGTALDLASGEWTHARIVVRPRGLSDVTVSLAGF